MALRSLTDPSIRRPLRLIDEHGLLSRNPEHWPEEVKAAIAKCCCETSSTPSSFPDVCCSGVKLPEVLRGNIRNTTIHDTSLSLRYWPGVRIKFNDPLNLLGNESYPPWLPREAMPWLQALGGTPALFTWGPAWYSDLYEDYQCDYDLTGHYFRQLNPPFGFAHRVDYRVQMHVDVFSYVALGLPIAPGLDGSVPPPLCSLFLIQCAYPTGTITYTVPLGTPPIDPTSITYQLAVDADNGGGPGVIDRDFGRKTSVVRMVGGDGGVLDGACWPKLTCKPWRRFHLFNGNPSPNPGAYVPGAFVRCLDVKALSSDIVAPGAYARTLLASPVVPADVENYVDCDDIINLNTSPQMEAFI